MAEDMKTGTVIHYGKIFGPQQSQTITSSTANLDLERIKLYMDAYFDECEYHYLPLNSTTLHEWLYRHCPSRLRKQVARAITDSHTWLQADDPAWLITHPEQRGARRPRKKTA